MSSVAAVVNFLLVSVRQSMCDPATFSSDLSRNLSLLHMWHVNLQVVLFFFYLIYMLISKSIN